LLGAADTFVSYNLELLGTVSAEGGDDLAQNNVDS
jgi:hypothetical protein